MSRTRTLSIHFFAAFTAMLMLVTFVSGCSEDDKGTATIPSEDDEETIDSTVSPLYIEVSTRAENNPSGTKTFEGGCYVDPTATAPSTKTCTINIPELKLHYSDIIFKVGTFSATKCYQVMFVPYIFRRSDSNVYEPVIGGPTIDCQTAPVINPRCYGGPAIEILSTLFPTYSGKYILTTFVLNAEFTSTSINGKNAQPNPDSSMGDSNIDVANNLATGDRANPVSNGGARYMGGNQFTDYTVICRDVFNNDQHTITLILGDLDTTGVATSPANDDYFDWN